MQTKLMVLFADEQMDYIVGMRHQSGHNISRPMDICIIGNHCNHISLDLCPTSQSGSVPWNFGVSVVSMD